MMELIEKYQNHLIYFFSVVVAVIVLRFLTRFIYKKLLAKTKERYPQESGDSIILVKRVLNLLWLVLGFIALAFLWVPADNYARLEKNFKLFAYLGVVMVLTIIASSAINMWFQHVIRKRLQYQTDITNIKFLRYMIVAASYFIGLLLMLAAFPSFRGIAQTALGGAGVLAVIAGIASQEALSNVVSGIFIISSKPFKIGDIIELAGTMEGKVVDITLRHTIIQNFENKMIVIPNSIINKEKLVNATMRDLRCCERLEINISYDSDVDIAKRIMKEECEKHPLILDNRTKTEKKNGIPIVKTALIRLNENSVTIRAWAWVRNYDALYQLRWDVLETIKKRFNQEGIELPFPNRTVTLRQGKPVKMGMFENGDAINGDQSTINEEK